jgi:hypothetical protein
MFPESQEKPPLPGHQTQYTTHTTHKLVSLHLSIMKMAGWDAWDFLPGLLCDVERPTGAGMHDTAFVRLFAERKEAAGGGGTIPD